MEEQQHLYTSPATNIESQEEESFFESQSFTMHTSQIAASIKAASPSKPTRSKKAKNETLEVVRELKEISSKVDNMMKAVGAHIGSLASCFRHESDAVERRMTVISEMMKILGLSSIDIVRVGRKIATDPLETDYFFGLSEELRKIYVLSIFSELQGGGGV